MAKKPEMPADEIARQFREQFVLGGAGATITVVGHVSRYTFRFGYPDKDYSSRCNVELLTGPDNSKKGDWTWIGTIFQHDSVASPNRAKQLANEGADMGPLPKLGGYRHGKNSFIEFDTPAASCARWLFGPKKGLIQKFLPVLYVIDEDGELTDEVRPETVDVEMQVFRSANCSVCGRKLTTPESIKRGMGPTCFEKFGA